MDNLTKVVFCADRLPEVQSIDCGDTPCGMTASKWIKGDKQLSGYCALGDMEKYGTEVWLYRNEAGQLVGFASLGVRPWGVPTEKDPRQPISIIPWIGIDKQFWKKPDGAPEPERYSSLIMFDLIEEAISHQERAPFLGLCVHRSNIGAIKLYERFNFGQMKKPYKDTETGVTYNRMLLRLGSKEFDQSIGLPVD